MNKLKECKMKGCKMKMKIQLMVIEGNNLEVVEGTLCDVGLPYGTTVVHRFQWVSKYNPDEIIRDWRVTHVESGLRIDSGETRKKAIENSRDRVRRAILHKGFEDIKERCIKQSVDFYTYKNSLLKRFWPSVIKNILDEALEVCDNEYFLEWVKAYMLGENPKPWYNALCDAINREENRLSIAHHKGEEIDKTDLWRLNAAQCAIRATLDPTDEYHFDEARKFIGWAKGKEAV